MKKPRRPRKPKVLEQLAPAPDPDICWADPDKVTQIQWLIPEILPRGCLAVVEGRKNTGKSSVLAAIAAAMTGGRGCLGWHPKESLRVLWEPREESWEQVVMPRLIAAGANVSCVGRPTLRDAHGRPRRLMLPGDLLQVEEMIARNSIGLIVLDPFGSIADPGLDLSRPAPARMYAELIQDLMIRTNCTCLMSRHVQKGRGHDVRDAGYGSGEITNVARSLIRLGEHPHQRDQMVLSVATGNHASRRVSIAFRLTGEPGLMPVIDWLGEVSLTPEEVAQGRGDEAETDEWSAADTLLHALIGVTWCRVAIIQAECERAGITPHMLRRAKARLKLPHRRVQLQAEGHWEWGPPRNGWPATLSAPIEPA